MSLYKDIHDKMWEMINSGMTQNELSKATGISQSYISQLLSQKDGKDRMQHLELAKFLKLFPHASINLDGDVKQSMGDVHHNQDSTIVQGRHVSIGGDGGESAASLLRRIMASPDLDAETKVKLYNIAQEKQD